MSISRSLNIASSALGTYQKAMDVTSNNIANSSNSDYTRQTVNLSSSTSTFAEGIFWGSGVQVDSVTRIKDQFVEKQLISYNAQYASYNEQYELLSEIEQYFSEPTDLGLSSLMDDFFSAWSELAVSPNSSSLRNQVIYSAQNVVNQLASLNDNLNTVKNDIVNDFESNVDTVNNLLSDIQELNQKIFASKSVGGEPNELLDQRDALIMELSELTDINVTYDDYEVATVSIGGVLAADKVSSVKFEATQDLEGNLSLVTADGGAKVTLTGGKLYAQYDVYSNTIPEYEAQLQSVVDAMVAEVNSVHSSGYSLDGTTGTDFFVVNADGSIEVNEDIINDPNLIAASLDGTEGNGDIANSIAEIANGKIVDNQTLAEAYSSLISDLANDVETAQERTDSTSLIIEQLQEEKSSYSGVSIDEEMVNIITYQSAYQAAAKVVSIVDEMLDTLINMV